MSGLLQINEISVRIEAGASMSSLEIATSGQTPLWIDTPAGFTGLSIGFATGDGLRTLRGVYGQELLLALGAAGSRHCLLEGGLGWLLMRMRSCRIYSGTGFGAQLPQAAAQTLVIGMSNI